MSKIIQGHAIKWISEKEELLVSLYNKKLITIPKGEISLYSLERVDKVGTPYIIYDFLHQTISLMEIAPDIFSHRAVMLEQYNSLQVDSIIRATVSSFNDFSVFLTYRDLSIKCSHREVSNSYIKSLSEYFSIGDNIPVKIIEKNPSSFFIETSYKQCFDDCSSNYGFNDVLCGKVTGKIPNGNGYFVEFSPVLLGIVDANLPSYLLNYGDIVTCQVRQVTSKGLKLDFIMKN